MERGVAFPLEKQKNTIIKKGKKGNTYNVCYGWRGAWDIKLGKATIFEFIGLTR